MSKKPTPRAVHREPPAKIATGPNSHFNMRFDTAELLCVMDRVTKIHAKLPEPLPSRKVLLGKLLLLGCKAMESQMAAKRKKKAT